MNEFILFINISIVTNKKTQKKSIVVALCTTVCIHLHRNPMFQEEHIDMCRLFCMHIVEAVGVPGIMNKDPIKAIKLSEEATLNYLHEGASTLNGAIYDFIQPTTSRF